MARSKSIRKLGKVIDRAFGVDDTTSSAKLKKERDEARRWCCQLWAANDRKMSPQEYAEECGWDCFKEDT